MPIIEKPTSERLFVTRPGASDRRNAATLFALLLIVLLPASHPVWSGETRKRDDATELHGLRVPDPYRWLEKGEAPEVKAWITDQNQRVETVLSSYPGREALATRIRELSITSPKQFQPRLAGGKLFFMRDTPPQPQAVLVSQDWPNGGERVLVDTNPQERPSAITDFWPSPKGRFVAYGTADGGSELTTIHFVEVSTGRKLEDRLTDAGGGTTPPALVWDADESGVTYVRLPRGELFNASLYHHRLGTSASEDSPAFGQGLSRIAEWQLSSSDGGAQAAAAMVTFGDGAPFRVYLRTYSGWKPVLGPEADIREGGTWSRDELLVVSFENAPRGKILAISHEGKVRTVLPQGQWSIHGVHPIAEGFLVHRVWGADQRVEHRALDGKLVRVLPLPRTGVAIETIASSSQSPEALISFLGWTIPGRWVRYSADSGKLESIFEVTVPGDYNQVEVAHVEAVSTDGTRVPVTVLHKAGLTPDGARPTILYGYGGFGIVNGPRFLGSTLAWLEHGGVYAVATLRGGSEFGEPWHQAGMGTHKQNVFDDFHAAALGLIEAGWTKPEKLGILGGSNGGLLVGACMVQHPSTYRAVVGFVGIYDSLRHELWPNGQYNVPEYGTQDEAAIFRALHAYSPLHNVRDGESYPSVFLHTGENDLRVAPWQSRKFAARLQEATRSSNPILVFTETDAGHGQGASFSQRVGKTALALTFFAKELGLDEKQGSVREHP